MPDRVVSTVGRSRLQNSILTMENKLIEISRKDLPLLQSFYNPNEPDTYTGYTTIDTYLRWFEQNPSDTLNNNKIKFYSLNGDFSRGTYVVTDDYTHSAYADTLSDNTDELLQLLLLVDYSLGYFFYALSEGPTSALKQALKQKNVEISLDLPTFYYRLSKEKALEFDIRLPEGIELKPLNGVALEKAFSAWVVRDFSSLRLFERAAILHLNTGAFKKDGTLVAWVLRWQAGLLSALQTDRDHYGRGYGKLVTKALSKKIAETGCDVYTATQETNTTSQPMYEKLGFEKLKSKKYWLCTKVNWIDANE